MELVLTKALAILLLPPAVNLLLVALGVAVRRRRPRVGATLVGLGWLSLLALSLPPVSGALRGGLERHVALPPVPTPPPDTRAIVVLAGGRYPAAPEYGGDTVSTRTLARVRYAARLHRQTGLPILATGGSVYGEGAPEALLIKSALEEEFRVPVAWVETRSRTTRENAAFSREVLAGQGIQRFFLVTEATHMTRAVEAFTAEGLDPVPAPTGFLTESGGPLIFRWLPGATALVGSREALHAYLGEAWYRLRY
jgi:uncharacterized SAM-binding protein YcdF (DUF218 family)